MQRLPARELMDMKSFRAAVIGLCLLTGISALAVLGMALLSPPVSWFLVGFEIVIAAASFMGVATGLGRHRDGPAMALLCVAGAVGVGSLLGYIGSGGTLLGWGLKPLLMARLADAATIAGASGLIVLARRPRDAVPMVAKGLLICGALAGMLLAAWLFRASIAGAPGPVRGALMACIGVGGIVLISAGAHYLIRGFSLGSMADRTDAA